MLGQDIDGVKEIEVYLMKPMHAVQINTELVFIPGRTFLVKVGCRTLKKILNGLYIHMKSPVIFSH